MSSSEGWPSTRYTLLRRIRNLKDHEAWAAFVDVYSPLVYRFCLQRGLQDADARDVVQEVFIRVGRGITQFDHAPERGRFRAWLGTIIFREIQRQRSKLKQPGRGRGGPAGEAALAEMQTQFEAAWKAEFDAEVYQFALERTRQKVDSEQWQVFESIWIRDEKPREVARQVNRDVEWVYKAKYRVLSRLKEQIRYVTSDLFGILE